MSWMRTDKGLSVKHQFHDADVVVYVEGGKHTWRADQILAGQRTMASLDILFWSTVLRSVRPETRFEICSVGSKSAVQELGRKAMSGEISNTVVAMDRDYDDLSERVIDHPSILYTWGYSWENDVWSAEITTNVSMALSLMQVDKHKLYEEAITLHDEFGESVAPLVAADAWSVESGRGGVIPRRKFGKVLPGKPGERPRVSQEPSRSTALERGFLFEEISPNSPVMRDPIRHCPSHLFCEFAYRVVCFFRKRYGAGRSISREVVSQFGIREFRDSLGGRKNTKIVKYYGMQARELSWNRGVG